MFIEKGLEVFVDTCIVFGDPHIHKVFLMREAGYQSSVFRILQYVLLEGESLGLSCKE
jgi:hypothetical protein